jgi:membrane-bound lytic murein transglycosylase A
MRGMKRTILGALAVCSLAGASDASPLVPVTQNSGNLVQDWRERDSLKQAIAYSLQYLEGPKSQKDFPLSGVSHEWAKSSLERLRTLLDACRSGWEFSDQVQREFQLYVHPDAGIATPPETATSTATANPDPSASVTPPPTAPNASKPGTMLYTAYFEPVYEARTEPIPPFIYPLYSLPPDLVLDKQGKALGKSTPSGIVPYPTRREIEEGGLLKGQELAYLSSPMEVFLAQVQGSVRLTLPEGKALRLGYAGKSGRPYRSLGQALIRAGKMTRKEVSLESIKRYFQKHPEEFNTYAYQNESYVFFAAKPDTPEGPKGSLGVPLTAKRSFATDKTVFPYGTVALVDTQIEGRPFRRLMLNQDTGGAIIGPSRADLFWGTGPEAGQIAGGVKNPGRFYFLLLRQPADSANSPSGASNQKTVPAPKGVSSTKEPLEPLIQN